MNQSASCFLILWLVAEIILISYLLILNGDDDDIANRVSVCFCSSFVDGVAVAIALSYSETFCISDYLVVS